jgi:hypothetical protein
MNPLETLWSLMAPEQIPLWLKIGYTAFVCVLIPIYTGHYGPGNFLWFSDMALLLGLGAVWLESSLLASMIALAVLLLDVVWNLDFLSQLVFGKPIIGLSSYMFDSQVRVHIRALSLFHVFFPVLIVWLLFRLGYDDRALVLQTVLAWVLLPLSYFFTRRAENVNWVHGFGNRPGGWLSPPLHVLMLMVLFPVVIYLPSHLLLKKIFE